MCEVAELLSPKESWPLKNGYFEDLYTPAIGAQTPPLEGPMILRAQLCRKEISVESSVEWFLFGGEEKSAPPKKHQLWDALKLGKNYISGDIFQVVQFGYQKHQPTNFGGIKQYKYMVILRDFPFSGALFGLAI